MVSLDANDVGAAPAGFISGGFIVTELGQIGSGLLNYYSSMSNLTIKNIYIEVNANDLELSSGRWMATIYRQHGSLAVVKALDLINGYERQTIITNGVVGEWEWQNPPMASGVEYRTTERWGGQPVYRYRINIEALPNSYAEIEHGLSATLIVRCEGTTNYGFALPFVASTNRVDLGCDKTKIYITTTANYSYAKAYITIYYTKT